MAAYYSSFFSSGLLNSDSHCPRTPEPTTPRAFATNFNEDTTPTASNFALPTSQSSNGTIPPLLAQAEATVASADRPRMRRRRSSIGLSSSPVTPLKGALPSRAAHIQRQSVPTGALGVASLARSRSGSVTEAMTFARSTMSMTSTSEASKAGRMRSGSVGNALRNNSRRRKPTAPIPALPPPNAPLPALPQLHLPLSSLDLSNIPGTARRPGAKRAQTTDSIPLHVYTPSIPIPANPGRVAPSDMGGEVSSSLSRSLAYNAEGAADTEDYPAPLDTPGEVRGEYFA
ncbi:uncharacterized protein PHACADRAFT_250293 [Phanerochaete carnosa HHB-10118-sp]|uniref:Uncharacterized protein n=1 Tax=Phanerochaete carnosa (strain HHB-10118-sp) TaxID=650164 RepID=K5X9S1_PHACS|nr:uncharacterized protein PHACADRAFT_250293 [Phanerochaete carnosa HHB-10118-sp]EKM59657.1 hypothetical protein PHACADRAFT_250293 [Phanerochaete carnosa HHB-10118-sp]